MKSYQKGLSLIEMLIALVIGLIVAGSVTAIFISNLKSISDNLKMVRLNQELRGVMSLVSNELKRTGNSADATNTAFMDDLNWDAGSSCLRYSYDEDGDGTQGADERFGFHFTGGEVRWTNQVTSDVCAGNGWESLTDSDIAVITTFTAPVSAIAAGTIDVNQAVVTLTGQIVLNPNTATRTITETIRVRNEG